ncbi:large subunit terminase [Jeotgalibacillus alimentarius]|uniref:Large subunit terminase n=1 Tax=Jeotgalibacillus alimentarius TaxID=135826 RepID=A0A0C2RYS3_9BACL|nr:PBSX family phage terminase large subunit [Jeotgalibacillus alimentarius]KIL46944.1 large subunit terminase [Jeotgalibacillus alimentarius]
MITLPKKTVKQFSFLTKKANKKKKPAPFKFKPFSLKQKQVLTWWRKDSPHKDKDGIICDGSVRAGKTVVMSLSYVMWAMDTFEEENLGMSGKTIGALRRNVITPLKRMLKARGYQVKDHRAENYLTISYKGKVNYFYIFGGKDESSQDLIQGITLAGMFFDEVALMPESFVKQATARCSVEGSKYWFNCNPAGPYHWFKLEWLEQLVEKNMLHIHFTMDDNLSLSDKVKDRYKRMYKGIFFQRYILGLWVLAEGIIYDMFKKEQHVYSKLDVLIDEFFVGIDFGTNNPTTFLLIGRAGEVFYVIKEYYHNGRKESRQKTVSMYSQDLKEFMEGYPYATVYVDPSATPLIAQLNQDGVYPQQADNAVLDGIQTVSNLLEHNRLYIHKDCKETLREFSSYIWDEKAQTRGEDKPKKENDHCLDALRYPIHTVLSGQLDWTNERPAGW